MVIYFRWDSDAAFWGFQVDLEYCVSGGTVILCFR